MHIYFDKQAERKQKLAVISVRKDKVLPILTLESGQEYYVANDFVHASNAAVNFWKDVIANSPDKLNKLIGKSVLQSWEEGKEDGPGAEKINTSLDDWVENTVAKHPDIAFGHYAGSEHPIELSEDLISHLEFLEDNEKQIAYPVPDAFEIGTIPPPVVRDTMH